LPDWIDQIDNNLSLPLDEIIHYCTWHDCGKPYCIEIKDGKQHFPNHAEVSYLTYIKHFGHRSAAELIRRDMDIHLLKPADCSKFAEYEHAEILLLAGLCEIHANAEHSTGFDDVNFKIKWKHINQRGKAICRAIKERKEAFMLTQEVKTALREVRKDIKELANEQKGIKKLLKTNISIGDRSSNDSKRSNNKSKITALHIILNETMNRPPSHNRDGNVNYYIRQFKEYYKLT